MKNIHKIIFLLVVLGFWGCDKNEFADKNSDPSTISNPDLRFSMTTAITQMYENDYTTWFYNNFKYVYPWSQVSTLGSGNSSTFVEMGAASSFNIYSKLFPQTTDIRNRIDNMDATEKQSYLAMRAITFPIQILPSMYNTDSYGSIIYTEAGLAPYTNPPLLTPKYDNQSALYTTWLKELDGAISILGSSQNQVTLGSQDLIYGGDYAKWAKFCNLLKLKIAARLINQDRAKALAVAAEVANSSAGYMNDLNDDFVFQKGTKYYGTGEGVQPGYGSKNLIDFMVSNKDPRVRFIFEKNSFNAEVIQAFLDAGKALPPYVAKYVNIDNNNKFTGWKSPGEPWVRYYGVPLAPDALDIAANNIYFNQSELYKVSINGVQKTYSATSLLSEKQIRTSYDYIYPTKPGGRVIELKDNDPGLNVALGTSAETNLLLAEFKLLGANLPKSAQEYFNKGVDLSIRRMDALAKNNQMPYYETDPVYTNSDDAATASTKLKSNEIAVLLGQPAFDLSQDGLEKVYIQQYINYMMTPGDLWATVRRSGIPKKGSNYLAWDNFTSGGKEVSVPRRFVIATPGADKTNYQNTVSAITEQGFTSGTNDPVILSTQRLWFDKQNPAYGAGPK
jgi:hypothetical protein